MFLDVNKTISLIHCISQYNETLSFLKMPRCIYLVSATFFISKVCCNNIFSISGYDMSLFIRRYARYINQKAVSYRTMAFDFCRVKRGWASFFIIIKKYYWNRCHKNKKWVVIQFLSNFLFKIRYLHKHWIKIIWWAVRKGKNKSVFNFLKRKKQQQNAWIQLSALWNVMINFNFLYFPFFPDWAPWKKMIFSKRLSIICEKLKCCELYSRVPSFRQKSK